MKLTATGRIFAHVSTDERKRLFKEHLLRFSRHICTCRAARRVENGHIDPELWHKHQRECRVRRFWDDEEDAIGLLVHKPGGGEHARWMSDYGASGSEGGETGYRFGTHTFATGEYVSIRDHDGELHTFQVTAVDLFDRSRPALSPRLNRLELDHERMGDLVIHRPGNIGTSDAQDVIGNVTRRCAAASIFRLCGAPSSNRIRRSRASRCSDRTAIARFSTSRF
jgi:hypothetical protein